MALMHNSNPTAKRGLPGLQNLLWLQQPAHVVSTASLCPTMPPLQLPGVPDSCRLTEVSLP